MVLKVSLLPASYKKQLIGSKKKEQINRVFLVVLVMTLAMLLVVVGVRWAVNEQYSKITGLNADTLSQFPQLTSYQTLYTEAMLQRELIENVKAKEPYAQDFVVSVGNITVDSLWIEQIAAEDWFYTKRCTINGYCLGYQQAQVYAEKIAELDDVLSSTVTAVEVSGETSTSGERIYSFTVEVMVDGLGTQYVIPTLVDTSSTTVVDEDAGVS